MKIYVKAASVHETGSAQQISSKKGLYKFSNGQFYTLPNSGWHVGLISAVPFFNSNTGVIDVNVNFELTAEHLKDWKYGNRYPHMGKVAYYPRAFFYKYTKEEFEDLVASLEDKTYEELDEMFPSDPNWTEDE